MCRFFEPEVNFGLKLLQSVRLDLEDVAAITSRGKKQTNQHRALIQQLNQGMIPASWLRYKVPSSCSVAAWMTDFAQRVKQLTKVSQAVSGNLGASLKTVTVWMDGLFTPEAFSTATRQCVAQVSSYNVRCTVDEMLCQTRSLTLVCSSIPFQPPRLTLGAWT